MEASFMGRGALVGWAATRFNISAISLRLEKNPFRAPRKIIDLTDLASSRSCRGYESRFGMPLQYEFFEVP